MLCEHLVFQGISGIGYMLLRLAEPERVPCACSGNDSLCDRSISIRAIAPRDKQQPCGCQVERGIKALKLGNGSVSVIR